MSSLEGLHFVDGGSVPLERSLGAALDGLEGSLDQELDWDEGSVVMLGMVSKSSLGNIGAIEFRFLDIVPDGVREDFMTGFPIMTDAFVDDVRRGTESVTGLMQHLEPGFLGWVMVTQGWDAEEKTPEGEPLPIRMVGFYDVGSNAYWVSRRTKDGDVLSGWGVPEGVDTIYTSLRKMTEATHFLRIRRDLIDQ